MLVANETNERNGRKTSAPATDVEPDPIPNRSDLQPKRTSTEPDMLKKKKSDPAAASGNSVEAKLVELTKKQDEERNDKERTKLQEQVEELKENLLTAEEKLQKKEKRIIQLNTKLMDAVNKKNAYSESNDLYEEKLKALEQELTENLHQEGIRRQEAEYVASKLKKKVAELQFLLDERDQDSDSSYYSEDDDFDWLFTVSFHSCK